MARYSSVEERKQRANDLKNSRNYRYAYNNYVKAVEEQNLEIRKAQTIAELKQRQEAKDRENASFFVRAFSTVGDLASNIVTGALKGLEGVYDLGAGIVGAVGGIFSSDFQKSVQDHIAYDFVGTNIGQPLQELTKYSYTNDGWLGQTIENVASGLGQMLPAVAVNLIPGAGQAASLAMFGTMAAGNAAEEAYNDGASYWGGLGYGVASGLVEMATEKMFGGATKNILGKGYLDDLTKNVAKSGWKRVAKEALEEGAEEAVSELVNPLLKNIYKDKGFFEDFLTTEHLKDIGQSALVGAATSIVYGETLGRIHKHATNIQENINELEGLSKKEENLWAKNDFSQDEKITNIRNQIYENISTELKSTKPQAREKLLNMLDRYGLNGVFDADGSIVEQTNTTTQNNAKKTVATYNKEAYSPALKGKESSLLYAPTNTALTATQIEAKRSFNALNKGQIRSNLVFTNENLGVDSNGKAVNSAYVDGTLYISTKANAPQVMVEYEMTHSLEGTKAYNKYAQFILKEIADNETLKQKYGDVNELYEKTVNAYTEKLVNDAVKKGEKKLSREAIGKIQDVASLSTIQEIVARFTSENIFTNQEQITKLAAQEPSLVKKLANWIKNKASKLSAGTAEQIEVAKFLSKAEKLYNKALEASFGVQFDSKVRDVYNKEKGDSKNDTERRSLHSDNSEKWIKSKDSSKQDTRVQEKSRESGQGKDSKNKREVKRILPTEEKTVRTVKINQIDHKDWSKFETDLAKKVKSEIDVNLEFYDGSALPPNVDISEATNFDGFMDSKNNTMYLRSDSTLSEAEIIEASEHEGVHHIKSVRPELYEKVADAITNNIDIHDWSELCEVYAETYSEVYGENVEKIYEEIVADIVSKRIEATFTNVDAVNAAIDEMYQSFNPKAESKQIKSGDLKYAQGIQKDSEGSPLSPQQTNYFKDSKVRDKDGNLLVVYHGTPERFNIFKSGYSGLYGAGMYFTEDIKYAEGYSKNLTINGESVGGRVISAYINLENPLTIDNIKDLDDVYYKASRREIQEDGFFYTETKKDFDFGKWLRENYDGIIVNNPASDQPDVNMSGKFIIAFNSNQIKETTNLNPTISDDIRYVINKNKDIKDLVVIHNLSESKLLKSIELGGLVVPSIAITKDSIGHDNFGDISLIFKSDTINPQNSENKVFASDVYSKRFPKVVTKFNENTSKAIYKKFEPAMKKLQRIEPTSSLEQYLENTSLANTVDYFSRQDYVKLQYLEDSGIEFEPVYKLYEVDSLDRAVYEMLIEKYSKVIANEQEVDFDYVNETILPDVAEVLKQEYLKMAEEGSFEAIKKSYRNRAETIKDNLYFNKVDSYIYNAKKYLELKGTKVIDERSTIDKINNLTKGKEKSINTYVYDFLKKYDEGSYFRNNRDFYDRYGNQRSFNQLHEELTLESLLDYMTGTVQDTEGYNYGVGNIRSLLSKQFDSLQEIKAYKDKILPEEQMQKFKEASSNIFDALCSKIHDDYSIAADMLHDMAASSRSDYAIKYVFKDYNQAEPSQQLIEEIKEFFNTLKDYPTNYFEAKPQRVVEFDEVAEVIAPVDTNPEIIKYFTDKGIKVELYDEQTSTRNSLIKNLPDDIKFVLSKGQIKKESAKASRMKVYNKTEAEQAINDILADAHTDNYIFTSLKGAKKSEIVDKLWIALNSKDEGYRSKIALDVANFLIENAVAENIYETDNGVYEDALKTVKDISQYKKNIDLTGIKGEIKYKYDTKGAAVIFREWNGRNGNKGLNIGDVVAELRSQGYSISEDIWNDADQFFAIMNLYDNAKSALKKQSTQYMKDLASAEELKKLKQDIARDVLLAFDKYGNKTKFSKTIEKYQRKIASLTEQLRDTKERNKAINNLFETVDRVKALEKYKSADIELAPEVTKFINLLKKIKTWRGNLANNVREIMNTYSQDIDGKKLYELIANEADGIANPTAKLIEDIARNRGELTTTELKNLDVILRNFIHNVKNYDRVFFEGRNQSDTELATKAIEETRKAVKVKDEGFLGALSKFSRWLQAPVWRFERLSSYKKDGIMTKVFRELQAGNDKKALLRKQIYQHYEKFFKENKKVMNQWRNQTIEIDGVKLSKGQIISLYMLSLRKQAEYHLFSNETHDSGVVRISNENYAAKHEFRSALQKGEDFTITRETITKIENQLTDVDRQYIDLTRQFFDEIARNAKYETDMALFGVSNVGEENYIPIRVADDQIYKQLGNETMNFNDLFSVYSPSFNKDVKPNSKNKIVVENILDIVNRHASQMSAYYGLAVPVKSFNRIFNKKLADGTKLRTEIAKVDSSFEKYVGKLLSDLQGNIKERSGVDKLVSKLRGWGARAALGLNLKVLASQFVSLPAAAGVGVKYRNLMKGFAMAIARNTDFDKLTTYAPMLWERFNEGNTVDVGLLKEAKGVLGKIDMWTDLTTAPIGKIDEFVCGAVWNACIEQTKNNPSYENYSEEHYKAAAKLTEEAVIKTQANYTALYRPEILREQNSFLQLSTMFMSEPLQQFSLLTSAVDKIRVAKLQLKQATDAQSIAEAKELLKTAKVEAAHAISTVVVDTIILTLIAQAFRWLKGNGDDDEDKVQSIIQDFAENYIGMLPFVKDVYSYLQGYDVTNFATSGLTNIGQALKEMYNVVDLLASGKAYDQAEINGKLRKVLLGITQMTGIPLRNLETYCKGIIEKFSPEGVYKYEKFFYDGTTSSYMKELTKAIEDGDDNLADTILDSFLTEEKIPVKDKALRDTLKELYTQGYSVFPRTVGKTITINGEKIALTNSQRARFREVYQDANKVIKTLVNSSQYKKVGAEIQAKSINTIYDYYYDLAMEDLTGEDVVSEKDRLFYIAIPIEELVLIIQQARAIESDKDKNGKTVAGSKKKKVQAFVAKQNLTAAEKYLVMGYLGYKNAVGENKVKSYIQRLNLTKSEKEALLKYCGYETTKKARR
jgi:hypothetical protein